MHRNV